MKTIRIFNMAILALAIAMASCSDGEDGTNGMDGIDGIDGTNGQDGQDGANGKDGANAAGYDQLAKYGHISLQLEGTRPDGVPFQDTAVFKFTSMVHPYGNLNNNWVSEADDYGFVTTRFLSAPGDVFQSSYVTMGVSVEDLGGAGEQLTDLYFELYDYTVIGEDNTYFQLFFLDTPAEAILSDLSFEVNADGNHLVYTVSFTQQAGENSSGHDLHVTATVDVRDLELIPTL
ncbi:hypothetical protein [Flagellimonas baculiformis]|uniref:hypothetical protein n=1 Tax=Flagellimonas baculiformis TaxID=3067310 RepID=UPI00296F2C99|nr:hypothetical protein [Muricauda sp. D6]